MFVFFLRIRRPPRSTPTYTLWPYPTLFRSSNGDAGEESGAMQAATIDVPAGFGIRLTAIPQPADPSCKFIRVYMSEADGDVLHSAAQLAVGATQYDLGKRALDRKSTRLNSSH